MMQKAILVTPSPTSVRMNAGSGNRRRGSIYRWSSNEVQVILQALKTYGMMLADNGSAWYISGVPDKRWDNDALHELHNCTVPISRRWMCLR